MAAFLIGTWAFSFPHQETEITARLKDLGSADVRTVYRAVERLTQLGDAALPALDAHLRQAARPVRPYVELALQEIGAGRSQPDYPKARRHSLKSSDKNAADLLVDLKSRTGLPLSIESLLDEEKLPELSLDLRDATPLEAVDAVCKAGGLTMERDGARFEIYSGGYPDFPKFFYDHYLFRLETYARTRSVSFRKPLRDRLRIDLTLLWDSGISPARLLPARLLEAVDETGKDLIPPPEPAKTDPPAADPESSHPPVPEGTGRDSLEILPPAPKAAKIARLRGVVPVLHPKARVDVTFKNPAAGQTKEAGGFHVTLKAIDRENFALDLFITSKTMKTEELRTRPVVASLRLKGQETPRCVASSGVEEGGLRVRVEFVNVRLQREAGVFRLEEPLRAADIQTFQLTVVTETVERRVPFEFRDVTVR